MIWLFCLLISYSVALPVPALTHEATTLIAHASTDAVKTVTVGNARKFADVGKAGLSYVWNKTKQVWQLVDYFKYAALGITALGELIHTVRSFNKERKDRLNLRNQIIVDNDRNLANHRSPKNVKNVRFENSEEPLPRRQGLRRELDNFEDA